MYTGNRKRQETEKFQTTHPSSNRFGGLNTIPQALCGTLVERSEYTDPKSAWYALPQG